MITKPCHNCGYPGGVAMSDCNVCGGSGMVHEFEPSDGLISDAIPLSERQKPLPDNFANHPPSITEAKSDRDRENGGTIWTPRDALISILRKIDNGEINPDALVIGYRLPQTDDARRFRTGYAQASPDYYITIGILGEITAALTR